jgi:hypothetical protein
MTSRNHYLHLKIHTNPSYITPYLKEQNNAKPIQRQFSNNINPLWSVHIGALSVPDLIALQRGLGFKDNMIFIFWVPSLMFVSIVFGIATGIITLIPLYTWNRY